MSNAVETSLFTNFLTQSRPPTPGWLRRAGRGRQGRGSRDERPRNVAGYRATTCNFRYVVIRTGTGRARHPPVSGGLVARPSFLPRSFATFACPAKPLGRSRAPPCESLYSLVAGVSDISTDNQQLNHKQLARWFSSAKADSVPVNYADAQFITFNAN
jgi:hypothetical protein